MMDTEENRHAEPRSIPADEVTTSPGVPRVDRGRRNVTLTYVGPSRTRLVEGQSGRSYSFARNVAQQVPAADAEQIARVRPRDWRLDDGS